MPNLTSHNQCFRNWNLNKLGYSCCFESGSHCKPWLIWSWLISSWRWTNSQRCLPLKWKVCATTTGLGHKVLRTLLCSPEPGAVTCHFSKHLHRFLQGNCFTSKRSRKYFPRVHWIPSMHFISQGLKQNKTHVTFNCKKCVDWNGFYFD